MTNTTLVGTLDELEPALRALGYVAIRDGAVIPILDSRVFIVCGSILAGAIAIYVLWLKEQRRRK